MDNLTTQGGDEYSIHREIDHLLAGIEFEQAQPVPTEQRVREFLAIASGPIWQQAAIISYSVSGGMIHQAALLIPESKINHLVFEAIDGSLTLLMASAASDGAILGPTVASVANELAYQQELRCLRQIVRAFKMISTVLQCARLSHHEKAWMIGELAHATKHLKGYLKGKWRQ